MTISYHPTPAVLDSVAVEIEELERQRQIERNRPVIALLDSWLEDSDESEEDQRAALEWLMRALDEDRPSERKLFP